MAIIATVAIVLPNLSLLFQPNLIRYFSLSRIDKQLKQVEEKNNVRRRWKVDQPTVNEFVEAVEAEERREVTEKLRAVAFDRWFLLSLKRKYSSKCMPYLIGLFVNYM